MARKRLPVPADLENAFGAINVYLLGILDVKSGQIIVHKLTTFAMTKSAL